MRKNLYIGIMIVMDAFIVVMTTYLSLFLRFDGKPDPVYSNVTDEHIPFLIGSMIFFCFAFQLYRRLWRYASVGELVNICLAVLCFAVSALVYDAFLIGIRMPYSVYGLYGMIGVLLLGSSRLSLRLIRRFKRKSNQQCSRVLIVGAGDAGAMIAREIKNSYVSQKQLIGFIDDDPYKSKQNLFGVEVLGNQGDITDIVHTYQINEIIIAIPSAPGSVVRDVARKCKGTGSDVKIVPGLYELIDGKVSVNQLRKIVIEDLLRRDTVKLDMESIVDYIAGRTILVTGAGGSIGSELCRQISKIGVQKIILLGRGENSIYEIHQELKTNFPNEKYIPIIADVRDKKRLEEVFRTHNPEVVFHAAAHKHVPLMEAQPAEAIKNNIFGTKNVAECADQFGVSHFVLISTDKAVNPTSVMGATKRIAELILQELNGRSKTKFAAVRFGNVLGSRGSVIPLFKKQIARGGPVTITHPDMTRYFMTIPEAVQLVLQAGSLSTGGEVFLLDMGKPVKIIDMAKDLIELHGLELGKDIQIAITGLRPGEKLYEELLTAEEGTEKTKHKKIFSAKIQQVDRKDLYDSLHVLMYTTNQEQIRYILKALIPTYRNALPEGQQSTVNVKVS